LPNHWRSALGYFRGQSKRQMHNIALLDKYNFRKRKAATATTRTGLNVFTTILDQAYQTGRKVAEDFKTNMKIAFDEFLPQ
jgi:hypothetical protein